MRANTPGPHDRATPELLPVLGADDAFSDRRDERVEHHGHALFGKPLCGDATEALVHRDDDTVAGVDERDPRVAHEVDLRVHPAQRVIHEVAQRGGELDADRACTDDDE